MFIIMYKQSIILTFAEVFMNDWVYSTVSLLWILSLFLKLIFIFDFVGFQYKRHLFYHGESIPIVLENSKRASHNISNHILKILLEEVVGYEKVEILTKDSMNATSIMNRISGCPVTGYVHTKVDLHVSFWALWRLCIMVYLVYTNVNVLWVVVAIFDLIAL